MSERENHITYKHICMCIYIWHIYVIKGKLSDQNVIIPPFSASQKCFTKISLDMNLT